MNNPWSNLKKINNEYIPECDKSFLKDYFSNGYGLKLNKVPMPYMGDPIKAEIYLLGLNPGFDESDIDFCEKYEKYHLDSLTHLIDDYPLWLLNPKFENSPGFNWWYKKLRYLIEETNLKTVSNYFFAVEYFPYSSKKYKNNSIILPSQKYTFFLVEEAIKNNKLIILLRSEKLWYNAIPKLKNYSNKYIVNNVQNPVITQNNINKDLFKKIIDELKIFENKNYGT